MVFRSDPRVLSLAFRISRRIRPLQLASQLPEITVKNDSGAPAESSVAVNTP